MATKKPECKDCGAVCIGDCDCDFDFDTCEDENHDCFGVEEYCLTCHSCKTKCKCNKKPSTTTSNKTQKQTREIMAIKKNKVVAALSHGAHVGAADEAGNLILAIGNEILGNAKVAQFTDTPQGASITKAVLATVVMHAIDFVTEEEDQREGVEKACELVLEAAGRDLLQPHMKDIRKHIASLAKTGAREISVAPYPRLN